MFLITAIITVLQSQMIHSFLRTGMAKTVLCIRMIGLHLEC